MRLNGKSHEFIVAEINDTHEVFDRFGVPRTHLGEKLSLSQRAAVLEKAATAARIAGAATRKAQKSSANWKEFY